MAATPKKLDKKGTTTTSATSATSAITAPSAPPAATQRSAPKPEEKFGANAASNPVNTRNEGATPKQIATTKQIAATGTASVTSDTAAKIKAPQFRSSLSNNKTADGITDKLHRFAVSKVTEVATKSSKTPSEKNAGDTLLSEAQLLKMNDKDYMNEAQLAFFKTRLQQLEKDLLKNAGETTEHLRETVLVPDPADRATIEEEHALELRTRDRERKLLKKVQQSIASIDGGEYGWCEETGEPIGIPRLLARPTATLSLEAQQRRELKQKLYGD